MSYVMILVIVFFVGCNKLFLWISNKLFFPKVAEHINLDMLDASCTRSLILRSTYFCLNDWTDCNLNPKFWRKVAYHGNNFISMLLHN